MNIMFYIGDIKNIKIKNDYDNHKSEKILVRF